MQTHTRVLHDGPKNLLVLVRGVVLGEGPLPVLNLRELSPAYRRLRLEGVTWFIQEKMGLSLWLDERRRPEDLLLVLESRGWSKFQDFVLPDSWDGEICWEVFNQPVTGWPGLFHLTLDFDKVG